MYVHIRYCRSQFPACRCPKEAGGSYTCWPYKVQQVFHSPCCEWPCRLVKLGSPRAGDVNPFQSPRARAFSVNLLNVNQACSGGVGWAVQFGFLEPIPVSSTPSKGPLTPNAVAVKGTKTLVNTWGRNRRSTGNPAQPSAQLCYTRPTLPYLVPFYHLWVTLYFSRYWNPCRLCFFYSNCKSFGLVAQLSPWQQQSITDLHTAPKMAPQAGGWLAALTLWNLHTPKIITDVSAEWWKEKCFNFTAINRNIHYSTVFTQE